VVGLEKDMLANIAEMFEQLENRLGERFDRIEKRLNQIETKLDSNISATDQLIVDVYRLKATEGKPYSYRKSPSVEETEKLLKQYKLGE
jgi:hypothetical protein